MGPYSFVFHEYKDTTDTLMFLNDMWDKGYRYVDGLPVFYADTTKNPSPGTILHVMFMWMRA